MPVAALSLGGNQRDVKDAFRHALRRLAATRGVMVRAQSTLWRTPPWGKTDQPDFLNMATLVETILSPRELLDLCQTIERERGRSRSVRWGPRTLDIDIVAFGDEVIGEADLVVPHPRATERAFVLAPLAEIAGELPINGRRVDEWLARVDLAGARSIGPLDA